MFIFYIKIICIFPKFPGKSKKDVIQILSYTKMYNSNYSYKYNYNIFNDDKSKFQISPISSMLKFLSLHVKL